MDWTPAGENALRLMLGEHPSPTTTQRLIALQHEIRELLGTAWIDSAIGYTTLTVFIDFTQCSRDRVQRLLASLDIGKISAAFAGDFLTLNDASTITLPTFYSPDVAPDLISLAEHKGLSLEELIAIHSGQVYFAYANGFAPGFSYLGEVDERLAVPRLATPRRAVPAGSVAIADRQTAVYPKVSPGGWHIIGRCPTLLFDVNAAPPTLIKIGQWVKFEPIDCEQFVALGGEL